MAEGQEKFEFAKQFVVPLLEVNLLLFAPLFGNTYRDGFSNPPPRGGSFVVMLFGANLLLFAPLFGNTYRDGFYTLGRCTNLAAKQS